MQRVMMVLCASLLLAGTSQAATLCPDGSYVGGIGCTLTPDGTYVSRRQAPVKNTNGTYTAAQPRMAPDGTFVQGNGPITMCPNGSYVVGTCRMMPNGTYLGN